VAFAGRTVSDNSGEFNPIQVDSSEFNQNENKKSEAHENSRKSLISMIIPDNSALFWKTISFSPSLFGD
jgi:hypothetical protein